MLGFCPNAPLWGISLQSWRASQDSSTLDMLIPCAALTQTHPDLFPTMSTVLILLLTPMRRILVCYEMELDSCHTDIQLPCLAINTQGYLSGIKEEEEKKKIHDFCIITNRHKEKNKNIIRVTWNADSSRCRGENKSCVLVWVYSCTFVVIYKEFFCPQGLGHISCGNVCASFSKIAVCAQSVKM